jgi:protein-tyrosine sulfotransferase
MIIWRNIHKYQAYMTDSRSFVPTPRAEPSQAAVETASQIRGDEHGPAIMIHGIMPRSGTVYVGELLRNHPDLFAYPKEVWEFPFLELTPAIENVQNDFLWSYVQNKGKIEDGDFLPLFGASLVAYLQTQAPLDKRILLKIPGVQYLHRFFDVFPHENLLLLVRDGRDVVHSTVKTWPQIRFWMACLRWKRAASMTLYVKKQFEDLKDGFWCGRFEDAIADPRGFVTMACTQFGLEQSEYPWDEIERIPVQGSSSLRDSAQVKWEPVDKPEDFQPYGYWRKWSAYRRMVFKLIAGDELQGLGYGDEDEW